MVGWCGGDPTLPPGRLIPPVPPRDVTTHRFFGNEKEMIKPSQIIPFSLFSNSRRRGETTALYRSLFCLFRKYIYAHIGLTLVRHTIAIYIPDDELNKAMYLLNDYVQFVI